MSNRSTQRIAAASLGLALDCLLNSGVMLPARAQEGRPPVGGRPVKVAAVDFIPAWGDRDGNIRRLVEAAERVAAEGVQYAVFPETAISGYDFADPAQLAPSVDTIPGRASDALLPVLKRTGLIMSVGIAEKDASTGIDYNTAVLLGPDGIIGKYRKNGLNGQDVQLFGPGDTDVGVFDTPIGRIALIICYDDTYLLAVRPTGRPAWGPDHRLAFGVGSGDAGHAAGEGQGESLHRGQRAAHERPQRGVGDRRHPQRH